MAVGRRMVDERRRIARGGHELAADRARPAIVAHGGPEEQELPGSVTQAGARHGRILTRR